jgi:hypothetical protein
MSSGKEVKADREQWDRKITEQPEIKEIQNRKNRRGNDNESKQVPQVPGNRVVPDKKSEKMHKVHVFQCRKEGGYPGKMQVEDIPCAVINDKQREEHQQSIPEIGFIQPDTTPDKIGSQEGFLPDIICMVQDQFITGGKRKKGQSQVHGIILKKIKNIPRFPNQGMKQDDKNNSYSVKE